MHPVFYIELQINNSFNLFRKRLGCTCYYKDYWVDDSIVDSPYISIFALQIWC